MSRAISDVAGLWVAVPLAVLLDHTISPPAKVIYSVLWHYARPAQGRLVVWPGTDTLSNVLGVSRQTVSTYLHELAEKGLIVRKRRMGRASLTFLAKVESAKLDDGWKAGLTTSEEPLDVERQAGLTREVDVLKQMYAIAPDKSGALDFDGCDEDDLPSKEDVEPENPRSLRAAGRSIMGEWDAQGVQPPIRSHSFGVATVAGKAWKALESEWRDVTPKALVEEIARQMGRTKLKLSFETIFLSRNNPVLARLLDGDYATNDADEAAGLMEGL